MQFLQNVEGAGSDILDLMNIRTAGRGHFSGGSFLASAAKVIPSGVNEYPHLPPIPTLPLVCGWLVIRHSRAIFGSMASAVAMTMFISLESHPDPRRTVAGVRLPRSSQRSFRWERIAVLPAPDAP